jgi:hypothetical protein
MGPIESITTLKRRRIQMSNSKNNNQSFNVVGYAASLFAEFVSQQGASLVQEAQESISYDTGWGAELYHCEVRGLSSEVLEGEHRLSMYGAFQQWIRDIAMNPKDTECAKVRKYGQEILCWAKAQWEERCDALDRALVGNYDEQEVEIMGDSDKGARLINYLRNYAEVMSPKALYRAKDRIFALRKEQQEGREGLGYRAYVEAVILVLEQIVAKCNSCGALLDKFMEMRFDLQSVNCSENVRVESTASMSIDIEAAIDLRRAAERISSRHNVSVYEACLMLQAGKDMSVETFLVDVAEEEVEDYADDIYVD